MRERMLCTTLPICGAVIIAGALLARGGDLNPPPGPVGPTMHTLDEIYNAVNAPPQCPACTWDSWSGVPGGTDFQVALGSGVVHGVWLQYANDYVEVWDGSSTAGGQRVGAFSIFGSGNDYGYSSQFFQLDVAFDQGLYLSGYSSYGKMTVLYRANP